MGFLFSGMFWGIVLVLIGILFLLREALGVHIPIGRTVFAIVLIYIGVRLLLGGFSLGGAGSSVFGSRSLAPQEPAGDYHVVFGEMKLDLSRVSVANGNCEVSTHTVFGSLKVKLDAATAVRIEANASFASVRLPDGETLTFGSKVYTSPAYKGKGYALRIKADVVFGELVVETVENPATSSRKKRGGTI